MSSQQRITSSQANGRRSRGPQSAAGKAKSRYNALRHGLAVSVLHESALAPEIEALARSIAGTDADLLRLDQARRIAEAQVDLDRIQCTKERWIEQHLAGLLSSVHANNNGIDAGFSPTTVSERAKAADTERTKMGGIEGNGGMLECIHRLAKLDRYEQRAMARLKRAIRSFCGPLSPL